MEMEMEKKASNASRAANGDPARSAPHSVIEWRPIKTMPFGERVMLFFAGGERGGGEIDTNWVHPVDEENPDGPWYYWTWGGANAGSDFERDEKPVLWADPDPVVEAAFAIIRSQDGTT